MIARIIRKLFGKSTDHSHDSFIDGDCPFVPARFLPFSAGNCGGCGFGPPASPVEDDGDITLYFSKPVHFGGK